MKKTISILLCAIMAVALLSACGNYKSDGSDMSMNGSGGSSFSQASSAPMRDYLYEEYGADYDTADMYESGGSGGSGESYVAKQISSTGGGNELAEKIIYNASASIETIDFDESVEKVYDLMALNNAFIESSNIGGRNYSQSYYGAQTYRTAYFTLRVPVSRLAEMVSSLSLLGNVTSSQSDGQNITSQFYDMESRLNSYRTQEERLLAMLAKADTVADMIDIEQRLAEVRYSIESMTTTLRNWQNQVDYSTLTLYIYEVAKLSEIAPPLQRTYWQQIGDGLGSTIKSVGNFFMELFKWVIVNLPILAILAVIVVVVVIVSKRLIRRSRAREMQMPWNRNQHYPPAGGQYPGEMRQPPEANPNYPAAGQQPTAPGQKPPVAGQQQETDDNYTP